MPIIELQNNVECIREKNKKVKCCEAKFIIGNCFRYPMKIKDNIAKNI